MTEPRPQRDSGHLERAVETTQDVLQRYVAALGGTLKLIADFGDEQLTIG